MSAKVNRIIVTVLAVVVAIAVAAFAIWISATVGDPRVGKTTSTILTSGFVVMVAAGVVRWMYRDRA